MDAAWLGEDEHGVWLGSRVGETVTRDGSPVFQVREDALHLVPRSGVWWTVWFSFGRQTYVDVCVPAVFDDDRGEVRFVDLDLDVVQSLTDGVVRFEDEDELVAHAAEYDYPPHLAIGARASADAVALMLREQRGPFAPGVTERWWSALVEQR